MNWISATGFNPIAAMPIATPAIAASASGVSITRSAPKRCCRPSGGAKHAAIDADVLAEQHHGRIMRHLVGERAIDRLDQIELSHARSPSCGAKRSAVVALLSSAAGSVRIQMIEHGVGAWRRRREIGVDRPLHLLGALVQRARLLAPCPRALRPRR